MSSVYSCIGFLLAAYAVIGNDSVQTLGTFIASNIRLFKWYWLWLAATIVLAFTITWGWYVNDGDISFGRLNQIEDTQIEWYHALAPLGLLVLTRIGIPVSTTFLVLSVFASGVLLKEMLLKSMLGYSLAAGSSYLIWIILSRFINEKFNKVKKEHRVYWRILQWLSTGFLWFTWLTHDVANIGVYLPRKVPVHLLIVSILTLSALLAVIFRNQGGKIQKIILEKTGSRFMRSATIIDFVYAMFLFFFQKLNDIPMSTTWVFVGVLCGRELAIASTANRYKFKYVFPLIGKDFIKMVVGLTVSVLIVLAIHHL